MRSLYSARSSSHASTRRAAARRASRGSGERDGALIYPQDEIGREKVLKPPETPPAPPTAPNRASPGGSPREARRGAPPDRGGWRRGSAPSARDGGERR